MSEQKATYGLVGYPLGHSLSPVMHNTAFRELEVDAEYVLFPMQKEELPAFFAELRREDSHIFGLNVTVPHKENVLPLLDSLDTFAQKVGAVNTVVINEKRKLIGYNTDGPGFLTHLTECGFNPAGKRIAILGAGGAARALISVLCLVPEQPEWVKVYDIDRERAVTLVRDLAGRLDVSRLEIVDAIDDLNIELCDLLINATPIGMKSEDVSLVSEELLHGGLLVYDLVYNPAETALLKMAKQKGARTVNGLKMLYYQGVLAFQRWAQIQLPEQVKAAMWAQLEKACYGK
ncbi:MAG: shikimate dehydrogenase [Candidatus Omnitrophica bacterium]|nr:shikimate dehydrogenase [Candidatus Omnitrophota bacterium]